MRSVLLFCFFLAGFYLSAQTENKTSISDTASLSVQPDLIRQAQRATGPTDDITLSPEEQGFTKTEEHGKTIYRKEEGQLKIEYIPN